MSQSSGDRIGLCLTPAHVQLAAGDRAEVKLSVTNLASVVDQFHVSVDGIDAGWFTLGASDLYLFPGDAGDVELALHIPEGAVVSAEQRLVHLSIASRDDPNKVGGIDLVLELLPVVGLEMLLIPRIVRTHRSGRFQLRLTNPGNSEVVVDLLATDPEQALHVDPAVERVALAPGGRQEISVEARPRKHSLIGGSRTHVFKLLAQPAGVAEDAAEEPLAGAEGTLIYNPPLAFLTLVPRRLRPWLIALAGLLLAAALAVLFWPIPIPPPPPNPQPTATLQPTASVETIQQTTVPTQVPTALQTVPPTVPPATVPKPTLPTIQHFEVTAPADGARGQFVLSWGVSDDADQVTLDGQPKKRVDSETIQPLQDKEFELAATNAAGTVTQTIGIVILQPPEIVELTPTSDTVAPDSIVTINWNVLRAERASLFGQALDPSEGSIQVQPDQTTTYTFEFENELGRTTGQVVVNVVGSPPPESLPAAGP
jgi:hypothetical protein